MDSDIGNFEKKGTRRKIFYAESICIIYEGYYSYVV